MRKSKNYYKFMEYMAFGISGWHEDAVMVDNGVIECVAYPKVAHIEKRNTIEYWVKGELNDTKI